MYKVGIDAGSTTLKFIVTDVDGKIVYKAYKRHKADIHHTFIEEIQLIENILGNVQIQMCITGSAGIGLAERLEVPFVQEVVAAVELVRKQFPQIRTLFDLGGEDAKMVFFEEKRHPDIRMNGSCAGGTGAFIDQMASLMNIPVEQLGEEAGKMEKIYPIASRCGVFAKTDIQNLISRNIPIPDIAASTLHAVALQSITTLAHGCEIKSPALCIGGPLTFIPALRKSFCDLLHLSFDDLVLPENSEYFSAWGAALHIEEDYKQLYVGDIKQLASHKISSKAEALPALFENEAAYNEWKDTRRVKKLNFIPLEKKRTFDCFLGIDSGSTTTKIVVIDSELNILYKFYANNEGNSLKKVVEGLNEFYCRAEEKGTTINIVSSAVTGYGEDLIRSALNIDHGIVETMAHLSGAQFADPEVSFVLDIGGQDIKSIFTHEGVISNVELNEACSSGCGSFLQNFASTMHIGLSKFSHKACLAKHPSDLGSRCTVFMNSKVKQSLRENAGVDDIAAGLAYSVVKNCLFKVLKINNLNQIGDHIVVQGGTFKNDAVYRALELLSGKSISSTDYPELMGAFGSALYAYNQWKMNPEASSFDKESALKGFDSVQTSELQCKGCTNTCSILKFKFENGNICYAGNKCEKVFHHTAKAEKKGYNSFEKKNEFQFLHIPYPISHFPVTHHQSLRIGIPRVLNMFDNFHFWQALFSAFGHEVVLSPESTYKLYQTGVGSVMSDNICFPAKLVHGHIMALIDMKVDRIFYPIIPKEFQEFEDSSNSFNCPVVSGYPDVIRSAIDPEGKYQIPFDSPVIGFNDDKVLKKTCWRYFSSLGIDKKIFDGAFRFALTVRAKVKNQLISFQKGLLQQAIENNTMTFVIAGRPYHADPLIHQKTGQILADLGATVLTEDVFLAYPTPQKGEGEAGGFSKLNIVSQWSYPNRVVQSALQVAKLPQNIQMIQLNSFGCGPDSFLMDEVSSILHASNKNLTIIRIDEISSPGSIRLRLRSLIESLKNVKSEKAAVNSFEGYHIPYTEEDKKKTVLIPWFADFLSPLIPPLGKLAGYTFKNLPKSDKISAELGLKYGHNEVCYPSTLILGDIIKALQSGEYDINDVVICMTQTGGQCRATNYIAQIKTGLKRAGFSNIPVIAIAAGESFQNDQKEFKIPWLKIINMVVYAALYGDAIQQMFGSVTIREKGKGEAKKLFDFYMERGIESILKNDHKAMLRFLEQAVADFNNIPITGKEFSKIGVIGEIFVKYNNYAQAYISEWLREKGMEVVIPPVIDFFMQYFVNSRENIKNGVEKGSIWGKALQPVLWNYVNKRIRAVETIMKNFRFYQPSESIYAKAGHASEILNLSNQFGEGWCIAAEVAHYAHHGINKVVCIQPFGCIANHVVAKGIEKRLKKFYPDTGLLYLDVDGGIAEVNLQNRLHFMIG